MSSDGPTLNDDSFRGGRAPEGHTHTHGNGLTHRHGPTPGHHAHAEGREAPGLEQDERWPPLRPPRLPLRRRCLRHHPRDGCQQEGLSLTVDDKLRVAEQLDHLGVTFIEGGWPGANPKDEEFFARAPTRSRCRGRPWWRSVPPVVRGQAEDDETLRHLVEGPDRGGVHRRQIVRDACGRGASYDPRRGGCHGGRLSRVPPRQRPPGLPRCRALLRRVQGQPRIHHPHPPRRRRGRGRDARPL